MKRKILSLLLVLSLFMSGIPAFSADAEEPVDGGGMDAEAKMAGSNGILYEGVAYLSAGTVLSMDEEVQEAYYGMCDEIASYLESGMEFEDVVIAVDEEGNLYSAGIIPARVLDSMERELFLGMETGQEAESEKETKAESAETETAETKPVETESAETGPAETECAETETVSAEFSETVSTGTDPAESEQDTAELETEKAAETESERVALSQLSEGETSVHGGENMELLPDLQEETFELAEPVRLEAALDLGYGEAMDGTESEGSLTPKEVYTLLLTEGYFRNQLTNSERRYYDLIKNNFLSGRNSISYQDSYRVINYPEVCHAMSAVIMEYREKTDWIARPGGAEWKTVYNRKTRKYQHTVSRRKSPFYSASLDARANAQVKKIAEMALQYGQSVYPAYPAYGVVRYFDDWLCENSYYENVGTIDITGETPRKIREQYYYCHSAYGALLKGYSVCESYAESMARLLDAVGIPNMYVVGDAGGGHAWNYVYMPNKQWYMVDSTWNDSTNKAHTQSSRKYLLVASDGVHRPEGTEWSNERNFSFPSLASARYNTLYGGEKLTIAAGKTHLQPKETTVVSILSGYSDRSPKLWSSSDTRVAKVDKNGKVTAVAPGFATITLLSGSVTGECTVYVNQIKSLTSAENKKANDTLSLGIAGTQGADAEAKQYIIDINMEKLYFSAESMIKAGQVEMPSITYSNKKVNVAEVTDIQVTGNQIILKIKPNVAGKTNIKVKFGNRQMTIQTSVGKFIQPEWFQIEKLPDDSTSYTGIEIKPTVTKLVDERVTYKVVYANNKNVGTASVKIIGTGSYGGDVTYSFAITPADISGAVFDGPLKSKQYSGDITPPDTLVKLGNKTLKAGVDYTILYNGGEPFRLPAGTYDISVRGKGNYAGIVPGTLPYTVTPTTLARVSLSCPSVLTYNGRHQYPARAKIGKNVLDDYDVYVFYYIGGENGKCVYSPMAKGTYTAVLVAGEGNVKSTEKVKKIVRKFVVR